MADLNATVLQHLQEMKDAQKKQAAFLEKIANQLEKLVAIQQAR
jgi:hypothetical protein